jgi:hypothetical protein
LKYKKKAATGRRRPIAAKERRMPLAFIYVTNKTKGKRLQIPSKSPLVLKICGGFFT